MSSTINKEEIQKFSKLAEEWWDVNGKFKPLHMFNPVRIEYITENIYKHFNLKKKTNPLNGLNILDIGCGGGLISEPMARLGASVTGIDASEKNITVAKLHSKKSNLRINYLNTSPENLSYSEKFDIILNLEVVEHVNDEYILRWLPIGTHDWNKFIKPEELEKYLSQENFSSLDIAGLKFNPFTNKWKKTKDLSVNYIIASIKS
jgi:2-polyprenyl-6-hydroxyphenyl methylase/3-demethylubiquinone-9 3-methyltransferase